MVNARTASIVCIISVAMVAATMAAGTRPTPAQITLWIIAKPNPEYPLEAQARRARGSGEFLLHFITTTGTVRRIEIVKSTGDKALDSACIQAYSRWRFKPGVLPSAKSLSPLAKRSLPDDEFLMKIPVTFTLAR